MFQLKGLHSGIVLRGKSLDRFSDCGPSPSSTYVTFLVDRLFPIEEVIGHIWHRPNGASLHYIRRVTGRDITEEETHRVFKNYISMSKRTYSGTVYISIAAYFRLGGIAEKTGYQNKRWNLCSLLVGYFLNSFGLLTDGAVENNLLPKDFLNLRFYQSEEYERVEIFDKGTHRMEWFFSGLLIRFNLLEINPVCNSTIDRLLKNYNYPQQIRSSREERRRYNQYLAES